MSNMKQNVLKDVFRPYLSGLASLVVFSFFSTLLNLVPPIFMMQLSERVMLSRNETTLLFLTLIAFFLIAALTVLDSIRARQATPLADDSATHQVRMVLGSASRAASIDFSSHEALLIRTPLHPITTARPVPNASAAAGSGTGAMLTLSARPGNSGKHSATPPGPPYGRYSQPGSSTAKRPNTSDRASVPVGASIDSPPE